MRRLLPFQQIEQCHPVDNIRHAHEKVRPDDRKDRTKRKNPSRCIHSLRSSNEHRPLPLARQSGSIRLKFFFLNLDT